jgi:uncharacterized membrane protein
MEQSFEPQGETRELDAQAAREGANRWLARFAPLLHGLDALSAADCRTRLARLKELKPEAGAILTNLRADNELTNTELLSTLEAAAAQIDNVESLLQRRLASLAPGDPAGLVDLQALRKDLAEVAARHEVEEVVGIGPLPQRLELKLSNGSLAAAGFLGLFSFGWLSFTTVHAIFMIGGMMKSFGAIALALLGFYAIFFAVGIGMALAAFAAACKEEVDLDGRTMTVRRKLFWMSWERRYTLAPDASVRLELAAVRQTGSNNRVLVAETEGGSEVKFGSGCPPDRQKQYLQRINEYLHGAPRLE